jgi:hypothetical protein
MSLALDGYRAITAISVNIISQALVQIRVSFSMTLPTRTILPLWYDFRLLIYVLGCHI